ncbi:hypothetical protein ACFOEE_01860 [Pseudoalteromonas fenneropenaei]|uniref:Uncharacterized protein n=1 Tax=Pseudoalteromonas fenneropenaei TaxID=1737459 RepID=A0ABV7CFC0_9GAMM
MNSKSLILSAAVLSVALTNVAVAAPNTDEYGFMYYAQLHESASYKGAEFFSKDYDKIDNWVDGYLHKISWKRYSALDKKLIDAVTEGINREMSNNGVKISNLIVTTGGRLTTAFTPGAGSKLDFNISGFTLSGFANLSKSWYADGTARATIPNITIRGSYDYSNGIVVVDYFDAPLKVDVDFDLNIPILGELLDSFVDNYIDGQISSSIPNNLANLYTGESTFTIGSIKDVIPTNKLVFNGVDYGAYILNKLDTRKLINDNFSFTVGGVVASQQYVSITIGSATYTRWTTGGKRVCKLDIEPDCTPY